MQTYLNRVHSKDIHLISAVIYVKEIIYKTLDCTSLLFHQTFEYLNLLNSFLALSAEKIVMSNFSMVLSHSTATKHQKPSG